MGKIKRPSIFRHKDGTMLTKKEEEAAEMKYAIRQVLDEMDDECIEISEAELEQRINDVCKEYGITPPKHNKHKPHTCKQCGAPLHNGTAVRNIKTSKP